MSKLYAGLSVIKDGTMDFGDVLLCYSDIPLSVLLFGTSLKKKKEGKDMARIINQPTLDLRSFSPEALKKIISITNVALVMLPENPTPEFSEAYAEIKKINVASETHVPGNACFFNGQTTLTQKDLTKDSMIVCNGLAIVRDIPKEMNVKIIVNGALIKSSSAFVEPIKINGSTYEIDDDAKLIISIPELTVDKNFTLNLNEKTAIIACGKVYIDDEITDVILREKGIVFYNIGQITAKKELHGYIQANSNNVALVLTKEEAEKRKKGLKKKKFRWR